MNMLKAGYADNSTAQSVASKADTSYEGQYTSLMGKVIAISGAGSGIGLATAKLLCSAGARLSLLDNAKEPLENAAEDIRKNHATRLDVNSSSSDILTTVADIRTSVAVEAWIEKTVSHFGALDGAVNLAGVIGKSVGVSNLTEISDEEWLFVNEVNLHGAFYATRAQLRAMVKLGQGPRSIINASSTAGLEGNRKNSPYVASKHAVIGLSRCAAKEFGHLGIRVNAIAPGLINTPMLQSLPAERDGHNDFLLKNSQSLGRRADPEEVARTIAFLLSRDSSFITGAVISIDGGQIC
ncbi:unnamed protein product [Clonostachys byssicola]|uniref:Uncharacterized protein n=1 Tax=Clonostachys byssicola TaxID=160290 RepID=A0A9N9UP27_9HYPO|nr:unnamed protein product [Clonostachys byssicola]